MAPAPRIACLVLCLGIAAAWNDCAFPEVGYFAIDQSPGISYTYALAAMNGNMYSGGYTKGNFAFVGVTDGPDVNPNPSATLWGDTTSDVQHLYVAEVSSSGSMTKAWHLKGTAIQVGQLGHGRQTNSIDAHSGLHAMLDKKHIAVKGGFRQLLELPDGTLWSSATRANTNDQVPFVMSIDVSSTQGIGGGTTGWAKLMDTGHAGGAVVWSVDGDTSGNMIVTYEGCTGFDSNAESKDAYGRTIKGARTGCTNYVAKLAAADGAEVWKYGIPASISSCRTITDGSFFCGWSMSASEGTLDFGNGIAVDSVASRVGIVKYNENGIAQWAKVTASHTFADLAVSKTGTLLAVIGSQGYGKPSAVSRIDTSSGNEGNVLWMDPSGVGTHGFRGVEVTDDDKEVFVFGQVMGTETLTEANGRSMTLRSRGSYDVFVAAITATDGSGKYAMDGGGTGMEYFFAMAIDPDTHWLYLGGTSRSEVIGWGDLKRNNVMYNGQPGKNNPDTSSAVGSSKAFAVMVKSSTTLPSCLTTCNSAFPLQASDVKSGYCYIDRHCYADGTSSPYSGSECTKCDAAVDALKWSAPDTSASCFINGACVASGAHKQTSSGRTYADDPCLACDPSINTSAFSPVAGCALPGTFAAGYYMQNGSMIMTMAAMEDKIATKESTIQSMQASVHSEHARNTQLLSDVGSLKTEKTVLQTKVDSLQKQLNSAKKDDDESCGSIGDELAITLIAVVIALLLITSSTLAIVICREKRGKAMFAPVVVGAGTQIVVGNVAPSDDHPAPEPDEPSAAKAANM